MVRRVVCWAVEIMWIDAKAVVGYRVRDEELEQKLVKIAERFGVVCRIQDVLPWYTSVFSLWSGETRDYDRRSRLARFCAFSTKCLCLCAGCVRLHGLCVKPCRWQGAEH